ncbi:MAG TPA: histidine ammonia-lyase, partial [Chromatiales bacterium]|nr:histidine ammonia-lyase [Chromatiales bacterium]
MSAITLSADANRLTLADVRRVWQQPVRMLLDDATMQKLADGAGFVAAALERHEPVYGINTGFGALAKEAIAEHDLVQLQNNLLLSHSAGTGEYLDDAIVRLILVLKIINLAQGYSGVSPSLVQALCALLEHEIYPCIPSKGSVGAS